MIEKIISGGQTGADRAALDAAIKLAIPHGGWIIRGRIAEDGPLPEKYRLMEMKTRSYPKRTEQNVKESDGTLIISRGQLPGGSGYTQSAAARFNKPCLHIDLNRIGSFPAASRISRWLNEHKIKVLNVAGPRASKDPEIYDRVRKIIEGTYYMCVVRDNSPDHQSLNNPIDHDRPGTVDEAVDRILSHMSLKDKVTVANMTEREVLRLESTLGRYIAKLLDTGWGTQSLMGSINAVAGKDLERTKMQTELMRALWHKLKATHRLKVVK